MDYSQIDFQYNSLNRYFSEIWADKKNASSSSVVIPLTGKFLNFAKDQLSSYAIIACLIYLYRINSYTNLSVWLSNETEDISNNKFVLTSDLLPNKSILNSTHSLMLSFSSAWITQKTVIRSCPDNAQRSNEHSDITFLILDDLRHFNEERTLKPDEILFIIAIKEKKILIYSNGKINKRIAKNIKHHINYTFSLVINKSKIPVNKFDFMSDQEKTLIINSWNNTQFKLPNIDIPALIERNFKLAPNKVAIVAGKDVITYRELNEESNRLANYLLTLNVRSGVLVSILLDRSIDMIITILAILKTGAAYIPIDSKYPLTRIKYIVQNSNCNHLISSSLFQKILNKIDCPIKAIFLNKIKKSLSIYSSQHVAKSKNTKKLAYLIYTSGSTGKPKGVLISHKNVINYAYWFSREFKLGHKSRIDFSSSIGFDLAVACTLVPLIVGASIAICKDETKVDVCQYLNYLDINGITHVEWIPDYFNHLLSCGNQIKSLKKLKWILLGGDALIKKDLEKWLALSKKQTLVNEYGPTECTVAVTSYKVTSKSLKKFDFIPIGKVANNNHAFVLDKFKNICPIGVTGELFIGGESVSPGYLNKEKNAKKFVNMRLLKSCFRRFYNTGDLVRWLASGDIAFLGRSDEQIKISGFRIELSEIENQLIEHPSVKQCKVIAKTTTRGEKFLTAYVVVDFKQFNSNILKEYLKKHLPNYMIPSQIINVKEFPTNTSGKIDLKALSVIEANSKLLNSESLDIKTNHLVNIWEELLGHRGFTLNDNFLDVGGGSLLTTSLMLEIEKKFRIRLPLSRLSVKPTIRSLLKLIDEYKSEAANERTSEYTQEPQIICLKDSGSKSPLFLIPPVGGTVFIFKKLVDNLKCDRKIFALQDPAIENLNIKFTSLEFMALKYISAIKRVYPDGQYFIAGASFGATLAVEIVNQLLEMKNTVKFLGLFDGWATYSNKLQDVQFFSDTIQKKILSLKSSYTESLIQIQFEREQLLFKYKIPQINIDFHLFKAKELWPIFEAMDSPKNCWENFIDSPIHVCKVEGDHETMFYEPNVSSFAKELSKCLD